MSARTPVLRDLYRKLSGQNGLPLEPGSPYYVDVLAADPGRDPIIELKAGILFSESESVDLLTGFRGNGKSTELRRLKRLLEDRGCAVYLVDMLDSLLLTKPIEVSDFLLALMAALSKVIEDDDGLRPIRESYWERVKKLFSAELELDGVGLSAEAGGDVGLASATVAGELALKLKIDPTFKERVQERLRGHTTTLVQQVHSFVRELVQALRSRAGDPDLKVVLLVDSIEQIRGIGAEAEVVHNSVVDTFYNQANSLRMPTLHVIYTVPPFFLALMPNAARAYGGTVTSWPNIHVRTRKGQADPSGIAVMRKIIAKRWPSWEAIITTAGLDRLAQISGGDIRDFFRLLRDGVVLMETGSQAEMDEALITRVEQRLLRELLPIARDDARWLLKIHQQKKTALDSVEDVPRFARFLDSNLVMNYLNGEPWYDIHPLIVNEVTELGTEPVPE